MNTCFAKSFHSSSTRCSKTKTGFSFNRTTPLPLIVSPPLTVTAASMPNDKLKDKIVSLKKELNRVNNEIYEMKLSLNKLENEKETNMKILDVVVADSENNEQPIELKRSKSVKEMSISPQALNKLKMLNDKTSLKRQILQCQRMIKEKEELIKELNSNSKVVKLIEKNKVFLDIVKQTNILEEVINEYEQVYMDRTQVANNDSSSADYYKTIYLNAQSENEALKEKERQLKEDKDNIIKKITQQEEKANNYKYQYNTLRQSISGKEKEIVSYQNKIGMIPEFKNGIENNKKANDEQSKEIKNLKDEINEKDKKIEALQFVLHEQDKIITNKERLIRKQKNQEINNYEKTKREIQQIEDEIKNQKYQTGDLEEDIVKVEKMVGKKQEKRKEYIKEVMENLEIESEEMDVLVDEDKSKINNNEANDNYGE